MLEAMAARLSRPPHIPDRPAAAVAATAHRDDRARPGAPARPRPRWRRPCTAAPRCHRCRRSRPAAAAAATTTFLPPVAGRSRGVEHHRAAAGGRGGRRRAAGHAGLPAGARARARGEPLAGRAADPGRAGGARHRRPGDLPAQLRLGRRVRRRRAVDVSGHAASTSAAARPASAAPLEQRARVVVELAPAHPARRTSAPGRAARRRTAPARRARARRRPPTSSSSHSSSPSSSSSSPPAAAKVPPSTSSSAPAP